MKVTLIARSGFIDIPESVEGTAFAEFFYSDGDALMHDADTLSHFAGRSCYAAWEMERKSTASNMGYLENILKQGHESVLEHGSVSFYVEGVSRSLLTELNTHRHLSRSVVSQRYVDYSDTEPVIPPAIGELGGWAVADVKTAYSKALEAYNDVVETLTDAGLKGKKAREAARAVLPNAAPVSMVVSGNHRAWRDMLKKRYSVHADAEICELAGYLLEYLRELAPGIYQDFPDTPFE